MHDNPYASPGSHAVVRIARRVSWQKQLLIFVMLLLMLPSALCAGAVVGAIASPLFSMFFSSDIAYLLSGAVAIVVAVWAIFCFLSSIDRLQRQELAARALAERSDEAAS